MLVGLALFLTFFVMSPVIDEINTNAYQPYVENEITQEEAFEEAMKPVREFMLKQTYKSDLEYFISVSEKDKEIETIDDVSNTHADSRVYHERNQARLPDRAFCSIYLLSYWI